MTRTLILHLGLPKTATSSLQYLLATDQRFSDMAIVPERAMLASPMAGAQRRELFRHVAPTSTAIGGRRRASTNALNARAKALQGLLPQDQAMTLLSEELFTLSPHTCISDNAEVIGRAIKTMRIQKDGLNVVLLLGTRNPRSMLDSAASSILAFRRFNSDTRRLEHFLRANIHENSMLIFRPGIMVELLVAAIQPDQLITLPIELLHHNAEEYHRRIELGTGRSLPDLPMCNISVNARPKAAPGMRVVTELHGPWRIFRGAQERVESSNGPRLRSILPTRLRVWASSRMSASVTTKHVPDFDPDFIDWFRSQVVGEAARLAAQDPTTEWNALGYED